MLRSHTWLPHGSARVKGKSPGHPSKAGPQSELLPLKETHSWAACKCRILSLCAQRWRIWDNAGEFHLKLPFFLSLCFLSLERGEGASEAGLPVGFPGFGSAQEQRWRLALELPGWAGCPLHAGGGPRPGSRPTHSPQQLLHPDLTLKLAMKNRSSALLSWKDPGPQPCYPSQPEGSFIWAPQILREFCRRHYYLIPWVASPLWEEFLAFGSEWPVRAGALELRCGCGFNHRLGLLPLSTLNFSFFLLKMNDFGIKNMDQVAPVASSYRGTLKVSERVLIKT